MRIERPDEQAPNDQVTEALAAVGLKATEPVTVEQDFVLWPENLPVFKLWCSVQTQWQIGWNGKSGLKYEGVEACMRMQRIPHAHRPELFEGLRVMEVATLNELAEVRGSR